MRYATSALLLVITLLSLTPSRARAAAADDDRHVVVISIDGFPAYLLPDPAAPIPTLRKLANEGVVAEGMRVANPSVTWPNHTTMITGVWPAKHSVLFNGVLTRPAPGRAVKVDPAHDQADLIAVPTIFEQLKSAGLRTAAINWPCTRNAPAIDDNFPDVPEQVKYMTPELCDRLVAMGVLPDATEKSWATLSAAAKDQVWTAAACDVIRRHKPNLLTLHLLICDGVHHKYGPQTVAGYTSNALADANVAEVLRALDETGIRGQTTVFVVADHGFASPQRLVQPNVLLRKEGLLEVGPTGAATKARLQVISEGGTAMVYCNDPATAADDAERAAKLFTGHEGIAAVIRPNQFAELGLPAPTDRKLQMADLLLTAQDGYAFSATATGDDAVIPIELGKQSVGYHGYINTYDKMNAVFIAAGRGIRHGAKLGVIENIDLAPTVAALLGQQLPGADGKVLADVLDDAGGRQAAAEPQWRPLFNGKDLSGWKPVGSAVWRVEDGIIVGGQDGDPKRSGLLTTADSFKDFELELEFMIDEHGKYNSGVYLRNEPGKGGRTGYQVNIGRGAAEEYCAGLYTDHWLAKGDETDTIRKVLQWNKLRIHAEGAHFVVHLNDRKVVDFTDPKPDPKWLQPGVLALQTYGAEGHPGWVKFRNVRIRELGEPAK